MHKQRIVKHAPILREKLDPLRRTVTCMLIAADTPDLHGDIMAPSAITAALDSYMDTSQVVGRMHLEPTASTPRRVWQDAAGNAWTETHVSDEADWRAIASGAYTGLSWAGFAYRNPLPGGQFMLTEPEMLEYSFVDKPAVPSAVFKSEDEADSEGESLAAQIASGRVPRRVQSPSSVQSPRSKVEDEVEELCDSLPQEQTPECQQGNETSDATLDAGPWTLDIPALAAALTQLLSPHLELAKRLPVTPLQPGPSQRIFGDGAEGSGALEEKTPAWIR